MVAMPHKLLLADDSVTIQRVIELTFADEDVQVTAVGNGQEAIDRVQRDRPDIVLADVGMPERNGYEVAAFIKGNPAFSHIPVVLLTGAFEPIDEGRARSVGCDGVLVKPFEPQLVISRVKDLLAGRQPSGMWNAPVAQGPVRPAAPERRPGVQGGGDPLEAYFDQLDAAFASAGTGPAMAPQAPPRPDAPARTEPIPMARRPQTSTAGAAEDLSGWDPDLTGDTSRPAPVEVISFPPRGGQEPVAATAEPPVSASPPPAPSTASSAMLRETAPAPGAPTPPSLVEAFAALLSAEARTPLAPSTARGASAQASGIDDATIETLTERVLARLSDQARPSILDVAERLVREEIDRIKRNPSST